MGQYSAGGFPSSLPRPPTCRCCSASGSWFRSPGRPPARKPPGNLWKRASCIPSISASRITPPGEVPTNVYLLIQGVREPSPGRILLHEQIPGDLQRAFYRAGDYGDMIFGLGYGSRASWRAAKRGAHLPAQAPRCSPRSADHHLPGLPRHAGGGLPWRLHPSALRSRGSSPPCSRHDGSNMKTMLLDVNLPEDRGPIFPSST